MLTLTKPIGCSSTQRSVARSLASGTLVFLCLGFAAPIWAGPAVVVQMKGDVQRKLAGSTDWAEVEIGDRLEEGTTIRTGAKSSIDLDLDRGHRLRLTADTSLILSALQADKTKTYLTQGKVLSKVRPLKDQEKFLIQTPSAVCAVRGTEFWTGSNEKGTAVEVRHGAVGMMSPSGQNEILVRAGERATILSDGSILPPRSPSSRGNSDSAIAREARHEVGLDMSREQVMAAAAAEIRMAEYREGKSLVDVEGQRVRLEEYIVRPQANQYKLVLLNERDNRLDYMYYTGTFNKELPADLSVALRDLGGRFGSEAPEYYLTSYERGSSNTQDSIRDTGTGGHLVNITRDANGDYVLTDPTDNTNTRTVTGAQLESNNTTYRVYDPINDTFITGVAADQLESMTKFGMFLSDQQTFKDLTAGDTFWKNRFNAYTHEINGISKIAYTQAGPTNVLASNLDATWTIAGGFYLPVVKKDPNNYDVTITNHYGDGTFETYRTVLIDDEGHAAPLTAFSNITSGAEYKNELLKWNYQQQTTATEFEGRKIDLVIEPKILFKSGLIQ
jgi:hypothetical protein